MNTQHARTKMAQWPIKNICYEFFYETFFVYFLLLFVGFFILSVIPEIIMKTCLLLMLHTHTLNTRYKLRDPVHLNTHTHTHNINAFPHMGVCVSVMNYPIMEVEINLILSGLLLLLFINFAIIKKHTVSYMYVH